MVFGPFGPYLQEKQESWIASSNTTSANMSKDQMVLFNLENSCQLHYIHKPGKKVPQQPKQVFWG
jgi:hypothetical protein